MLYGTASVIGALTGFVLSFTALSPLVIGGIVGSIAPALFTILLVGGLLYDFCKKKSIEEDDKAVTLAFSIVTLASAAIGVGLAAATTAIFPGAMLGMGSAALAGAGIGVIALIAGLVAAIATIWTAEKVNKHIISPIVEYFSSKEKEYKPSSS